MSGSQLPLYFNLHITAAYRSSHGLGHGHGDPVDVDSGWHSEIRVKSVLIMIFGRLHGKGYMVNVLTGKGMGWDPLVHQKEHKKLVQKSIYSYKSIR